mgnify:CR=1 FL=1
MIGRSGSDSIRWAHARAHRRLDPCRGRFDAGQVPLAQFGETRGHRLVGVEIDVPEGQGLQLVAHVLHAHAPGERGIDVHRLLRDAGALLRRHRPEGAHVVQPVGELDEEDADVVGYRQQELAQVLRLGGLFGDKVQPLQLGQAFHQLADLRPEQLVDFLARRVGVLDRVVQQGDGDRRLVEMHVRQDRRDFERMGEIGVATGALLRAMLLHGVDVGPVEKRFIEFGLVGRDLFDEFVLPHHGLVAKILWVIGNDEGRRLPSGDTPANIIPKAGRLKGRKPRSVNNRRSFPAAPGLRCRREGRLPTSDRTTPAPRRRQPAGSPRALPRRRR